MSRALSRRALTLATALLMSITAQAQQPGAGSDFVQVPGVYRQLVGALQVTALFDGVAFLPARQLKDIDLARAEGWLGAAHVPHTPKGVQTAVNAYLEQPAGELVLFDAGTAGCFGPSLGQVLGNLRAAGVRPEDVHHVLLTHAHPDHLCGLLTAEGQVAYPNATVWLSAADAAYWLDTATRGQMPEPMRPLFDMARQAVAPYQAAGRFKAFGPGDALPAGAERVDSPGHTPGAHLVAVPRQRGTGAAAGVGRRRALPRGAIPPAQGFIRIRQRPPPGRGLAPAPAGAGGGSRLVGGGRAPAVSVHRPCAARRPRGLCLGAGGVRAGPRGAVRSQSSVCR